MFFVKVGKFFEKVGYFLERRGKARKEKELSKGS
ncbi:hypothetical protein SAMN05216556_108134 [Aequorivita viscosa]|nr:hypothetical protein SAMN05216556_108134 [Aequorivita viscosa]